MKVAYLAPFTDGTGYAHAAINTVLGMDVADIDVYPREIKLAGQVVEPPSRIRELINKKLVGKPDVIIQNVLPPLFTRVEGVKNIGYAFFETSHFTSSNWQNYLNLMDEIWVCSQQNKEACIESGVKVPIKVVPIPFDKSIYLQDYKPLKINLDGRYAFYNIGDYSERKNIKNLIRAYFSAFNRNDQVVLVLKTYVEMVSPQQSVEIIERDIKEIKANMRLHPEPSGNEPDMYPPIILITSYLSDNEIYRLHSMCDCFVTMERGSAWNIPAFEAVAFGNAAIVGAAGGPMEYMQADKDAYMVPGICTAVDGMGNCMYPGLYSSKECWNDFDSDDFKTIMQSIYDNREKLSKTANCFSRWGSFLEKFTLKNAGKTIKDVLNGE